MAMMKDLDGSELNHTKDFAEISKDTYFKRFLEDVPSKIIS